MTDAIPAATLIAMRERPDGPPEVLMLRRNPALAFAGDAWVFPGGRIDPDDVLIAERLSGEAGDVAARVAAIRETIEEAGLVVGLDPVPDAATGAAIRQALAEGTPFSAVLATHGLTLRPDILVPWARWQPPAHVARRFDTYFYLVAADADAPVSADGGESLELCWASAAAMLARWEAGAAGMLLPTRANLVRLLPHADFASAARAAATVPVRLLQPTMEIVDDGVAVTVPDGHGYPPMRHVERR